MIRSGPALVQRLLAFADEHRADPARAREVGRARRVAAEVWEAAGRRRNARVIYRTMIDDGPLDEHRALGLFLLGQDLFFSDAYEPRKSAKSGKQLTGAVTYWRQLEQRFPDSIWSQRVARPLRYLAFRGGKMPPPKLSGVFASRDGERTEVSLEGLAGKVILIEYWSSTTPGYTERVKLLAPSLVANEKEFPDLVGGYRVLSVNVDLRSDRFDAARDLAQPPWPVLHDGRAFSTPFAETFGIPRTPHWVVISHDQVVTHVGGDYAAAMNNFSLQLRRFRGLSE